MVYSSNQLYHHCWSEVRPLYYLFDKDGLSCLLDQHDKSLDVCRVLHITFNDAYTCCHRATFSHGMRKLFMSPAVPS